MIRWHILWVYGLGQLQIYIPFDSKFTDIKISFAGSLDRDNLFFKGAIFYLRRVYKNIVCVCFFF